MSALASQLSKGVLNDMKIRILTSNIKKEKLKLTNSSQSMKSFFEREHKRYKTRKQNTKKKQDKIGLYRQMIRELVQANLSLAANKIKNINRRNHDMWERQQLPLVCEVVHLIKSQAQSFCFATHLV
jgi:hypothetical protein